MEERDEQCPEALQSGPVISAEPRASESLSMSVLMTELELECQTALNQIRELQAEKRELERIAGEHQASRIQAEQRLQQIANSRAIRLVGKVRDVAQRWGVLGLFRMAKRGVRKSSSTVRPLIFKLFPKTYRPHIVTRGIPVIDNLKVATLLPFKDWPRRLRTLPSTKTPYQVSITSQIDTLSQVVIRLDSSKATQIHQVRLSVLRSGQLIRTASVNVAPDQQAFPAVFVLEPVSGIEYQEITLELNSPSSSDSDYVAVEEFGMLAHKPDPWMLRDEVILEGDTATSAAIVPCFKATANAPVECVGITYLPEEANRRYISLYADQHATLCFEAPDQPITSLEVIWGTSARSNDVMIRMSVQAGDVVWTGDFNALSLPDNCFHPLPIPAETMRALVGRTVTVCLSSPSAKADNQVAILVAPNAKGYNRTRPGSVKDGFSTVVRSKCLSELFGTPIMRAAFPDYPKGNRSLRINVLLPAINPSWRTRRFARAVIERAITAGHSGRVLVAPEDIVQGHDVPSHSDILVVFDQPYTDSLRHLVTEVRASYGIVVGCCIAAEGGSGNRVLAISPAGESQLSAACSDFIEVFEGADVGQESWRKLPFDLSQEKFDGWLATQIKQHVRINLPRVSIVTVLYRKEREIPFFVQALSQQDYPGEVELVVVDDCSPDSSKDALRRAYAELTEKGVRLPELVLIDNESNRGNCGSRNRALEVVTGEVIVVVDCDCLLNRSFVSAHVYSHRFHGADVVIGPCNLESGDKDPLEALGDFDADRSRILREAQLQDPINLDSFVNCITRNFSIQSRHLVEPLFDELFGYSASPESGFGWEDVEMGYRLYKRGLRIYFSHEAFSVHVSHPSTTEDRVKPLKSLKNFRRLIDKHPAIMADARRWYLDTFEKIEAWSASCGHSPNKDQETIREVAGALYPYSLAIRASKKLRVLTYRWHVPHQYELYKLPHDFTLISDLPTGFTRSWEFEQRPKPTNATFRPLQSINPRDYDIAILHFDENVLAPENCNGVLSQDWGANFAWMLENATSIPMVAVCHGTPQFIGQYRSEYREPDLGRVIEASRQQLVAALGGIPVVCNSYQAQREWEFQNSRVIWHGFDPSEFQLTDYSGGVLSLGRAIRERPYYRGYDIFKTVSEKLVASEKPEHHYVRRPGLFTPGHEAYARLKFQAYRESIRKYSVYFNPTIRSPMPRSRGEAMMSGLVTVSTANHDVQLFIKNGWNGFYSDSADELAEFISFLMRNRAALGQMGRRSRTTAADVFNHDRYLSAWQTLMSDIIG